MKNKTANKGKKTAPEATAPKKANMTEDILANVAPATAEAPAEPVNVWTAPAPMLPRYEQTTAGEYIDMLSGADAIISPDFQRGEAWKPAQRARFCECLEQGRIIPAIIVAEMIDEDGAPITSKSGAQILLRLDGNQRTAAMLDYFNNASNETEEGRARYDAALSAPLTIAYISMTMDDAKRSYIDLNAGTALNVAQRNKAHLDSPAMQLLNRVTAWAYELASDTNGHKLGRTAADVAAVMLLTAFIDNGANAITSSAGAFKILQNAAKLPKYPAQVLELIAKALEQVKQLDETTTSNKGAITNTAYWKQAAHLVPLAYTLHNAETLPTAEELAGFMFAFNAGSVSRYTVTLPSKGKDKTKTENIKVLAAFADTSNSARPTARRCQILAQAFTEYQAGETAGDITASAEDITGANLAAVIAEAQGVNATAEEVEACQHVNIT